MKRSHEINPKHNASLLNLYFLRRHHEAALQTLRNIIWKLITPGARCRSFYVVSFTKRRFLTSWFRCHCRARTTRALRLLFNLFRASYPMNSWTESHILFRVAAAAVTGRLKSTQMLSERAYELSTSSPTFRRSRKKAKVKLSSPRCVSRANSSLELESRFRGETFSGTSHTHTQQPKIGI